MSMRIVAVCLLQFVVVWTAAGEPPKIEFRATAPTLRSLEPAAGTTPEQPSSVGVAQRGTSVLTPGVYTGDPFTMIVVIPPAMDQEFVLSPSKVPTMPTARRPLALTPWQH